MFVAHRSRPLVLAAALAVLASLALPASPSRAADRPVVTAVFGDSFAAGEGLPGVDPGEAECQRALGRASGNGTPSPAWGITVLDRMKEGGRLQEKATAFTACTGATTKHFKTAPQDTRFLGLFGVHRDKSQFDEAAGSAGAERFDVLLSSFGGNDLEFDRILMNCVGLDDAAIGGLAGAPAGGWQGLVGVGKGAVTGRCRTGLESDLTTRINGKDFVASLNALYEQFHQSTTAGALIVVAGYPQIVEGSPASWRTVDKLIGRCQGIHRGDVETLKKIGGLLNKAIAAQVAEAAERFPDRTWVFANVAEPFAGHGLCLKEGHSWINGLTSAFAKDFRPQRAFHPNQLGHTDGYASYIAATKAIKEWRPADTGPVGKLDPLTPLTIRGLGPLAIGMTVDEARDALGGEVSITYDCPNDQTLGFGSVGIPGIGLLIKSGRIALISSTLDGLPARSLRTDTGVRIGTPATVVREVYAGHVRDEVLHDPVLLVLLPGAPNEFVFGLDEKGVVTSIGVGTPASAEALDLCG